MIKKKEWKKNGAEICKELKEIKNFNNYLKKWKLVT